MGEVIQLVAAKQCIDCGLVKRVGRKGEFHRDGPRGWNVRCKDCDAIDIDRMVREALPDGYATEPLEYWQIGEILGITPQAVQQIEERALRKLRRNPGALRDWRNDVG